MKFLRKVLEKFKKKEKVIVLDTSALETKKALEILEKATKVILLTGTIREMDKYKDAGGNLGDNIRIISRKSREDEESQKYICVTGYERNHYQDDNIIDYCKKNLNAIILTNDNNLCNMAKAYGIPYIFPQDEGLQNIKGIIMKDGNLYIPKGKGEKVAFVVRNGEIIQESLDYGIKLQVKDIIYKVKYKGDLINISSYQIINMEHKRYAKHIISLNIKTDELDNVKDSQLPEKVKKQILLLLEGMSPAKKKEKPEIEEENPKELRTKEEKKDICQEEIVFYQNYIQINRQKKHVTYIRVERAGMLIPVKNYQEGDVLYILDYSKKRKYWKIKEYSIEKEEDKYKAKKKSENSIWYINEIFQAGFSKELQDTLWKLYLKHSGY